MKLNKFMQIFLISSFWCNLANADVICVKEKVETNTLIILSKPIKMVRGDNCPSEFVKLISTDDLKGLQGEKVEKNDKGDTGTQEPQDKQDLQGEIGGIENQDLRDKEDNENDAGTQEVQNEQISQNENGVIEDQENLRGKKEEKDDSDLIDIHALDHFWEGEEGASNLIGSLWDAAIRKGIEEAQKNLEGSSKK